MQKYWKTTSHLEKCSTLHKNDFFGKVIPYLRLCITSSRASVMTLLTFGRWYSLPFGYWQWTSNWWNASTTVTRTRVSGMERQTALLLTPFNGDLRDTFHPLLGEVRQTIRAQNRPAGAQPSLKKKRRGGLEGSGESCRSSLGLKWGRREGMK